MEESKSQQNLFKAYNASLKFLATRMRSVKEVRDNLYKKKFNNNIVSETILLLEDKGLLDDRIFAAEFILVREKVRPKSKFALKYELKQKGISESIIENSIKGINEYKSAHAAIAPKLSTWLELDKNKMKSKMMNFLKNRGFNWEISSATYKKICDKLKNLEDN